MQKPTFECIWNHDNVRSEAMFALGNVDGAYTNILKSCKLASQDSGCREFLGKVRLALQAKNDAATKELQKALKL